MIIKVFSKDELSNYQEQFEKIGLTKDEQQKTVLEFFYTLGKINYNYKIGNNEKES